MPPLQQYLLVGVRLSIILIACWAWPTASAVFTFVTALRRAFAYSTAGLMWQLEYNTVQLHC
jgi:hypothetical protein